jgi:hypothetical protein
MTPESLTVLAKGSGLLGPLVSLAGNAILSLGGYILGAGIGKLSRPDKPKMQPGDAVARIGLMGWASAIIGTAGLVAGVPVVPFLCGTFLGMAVGRYWPEARKAFPPYEK